VQRWEEAVERLAATRADDPARAPLEAAAQPPSAVMVWTPTQLGTFLDVRFADAGQSLDPRHAPLEVLDAFYQLVQW